MSRKLTDEEYKKTFTYKFNCWFYGTKDPYIGNIEMKPQRPHSEYEDRKHSDERRKETQEYLNETIFNPENHAFEDKFKKAYKAVALVLALVLIGVLLLGVSQIPTLGDADNPVNNEVSARYIEQGLQETGAVNIVTGMILDYRAFDTLGESHVLFIATCAVLILLQAGHTNKNKEVLETNDRLYEPKHDAVLQTVTKLLFPPIVIFGIYVILCGHLGPGGGFSGGAIIGAGLILYLNAFGFAKTERFFTTRTYKIMSFCALACYTLCKAYSFYTGGNHIESIIPNGTPGNIISSGLILILNICVGTVVSGTMYTFYVMFRKGGY